MPTVDLTARLARETKPGDRDVFLFDRALPGFGLRVHRSGAKAWIVQTRIEGKSRRVVIARHGEMDLAQARRHARDILARIRAGDNPADDIRKEKTAPTVTMLADEYLRRCDPYWKPSGRKTIRIYLKDRILPTFGKMPVERVGPEDVAAWFDAVSKDRPGAANRAFEILRSLMFWADEYGFRELGTNPCLGIRKNPRGDIGDIRPSSTSGPNVARRRRRGRSTPARTNGPRPSTATRSLLALTGCRRGEVLNLRWRDHRQGERHRLARLQDWHRAERAARPDCRAGRRIKALPGTTRSGRPVPVSEPRRSPRDSAGD